MHPTSPDPKQPQGDLRTTNRQDSTGAAAKVASSILRTKNIPFSAPATCPIDLFGPLAHRTTLKQLRLISQLVCRYASCILASSGLASRTANLRAAKQRALAHECDRDKRNQHGVVYDRGTTETNCSVLCSQSATLIVDAIGYCTRLILSLAA